MCEKQNNHICNLYTKITINIPPLNSKKKQFSSKSIFVLENSKIFPICRNILVQHEYKMTQQLTIFKKKFLNHQIERFDGIL